LRTVTIRKRIIPIWLVAAFLVSGTIGGAFAYYFLKTVVLNVQVGEPIEILSYPSQLSLFPGETKQFNITVSDHASVKYSVALSFSLSNSTYQDSYVTFSDQVYRVVPGQQEIAAWLTVKPDAPPMNATLDIDFKRTNEGAVIFSDDFDSGFADGWTERVGAWNATTGEYHIVVDDSGISTVTGLNLTDCVIETNIRLGNAEVGYRAGIVFRYIDERHYYSFEIGKEYDEVGIIKYSPQDPNYGETKVSVYSFFSINADTNYTLRVEVQGATFTAYLDGHETLSWKDETYAYGGVGLRARRADAFFNDFKVLDAP